jgi:hypothetical protein
MKDTRNRLTSVAPTTHHNSSDPTLQRQIAERAFQLFQLRGGSHGSDVHDWLTAEREVRAARSSKRSPTGPRQTTNGRSPSRNKTPKAA